MADNKIYELSEKLKELRDKKDDLAEQVKANNAEIERVESELIALMTDDEMASFNRNGNTFTLITKEYPQAIAESKLDLYEELKAHGYEHIFSINSNTLSATLKELKANNDDVMPEWLAPLVSTYEKASIRISKGRKI